MGSIQKIGSAGSANLRSPTLSRTSTVSQKQRTRTLEKQKMAHSPQHSTVSSTTSDLLQQSKNSGLFMNYEQEAQQDRSRLEGMLEAYKSGSNSEEITQTSPKSQPTNDDDYEDADDFIANKSASHSKKSSVDNDETLLQNSGEESSPEPLTRPQTAVTEHNTDSFVTADDASAEDRSIGEQTTEEPTRTITPQISQDFAFERPQVLRTDSQGLPGSPTLNRRSMISEYAGSIHEADHVIVPEEATTVTQARPSIVKISRSSSTKRSSNAHEKKLSTMSNDSGANSGESSYSGKVSHFVSQPDVAIREEETLPTSQAHLHSSSTDTFDFDVGPLNTKKENAVQPMEKELLTAVDPAIPSRSPRRPMSAIGMKSPVDGIIEFEKNSRRTQSEQVAGIDGLVDEMNTMSVTDGGQLEVQKQREVSQPRPLPPPPLPQHRVITPATSLKAQNAVVQDKDVAIDDGFVTEDEDKEKEEKKKKRKSRKSRSSIGYKKGHFNHDTLVTLLQATEGTIIGQEFQGIGLEAQDKQLVERLVDSLSRLTADMIVDGDRREESVKRLNKAIKALEGF